MISKRWTVLMSNTDKMHTFGNTELQTINKKSYQFFHKQFVSTFSEQQLNQQRQWCEVLDIQIENCEQIYVLCSILNFSTKFEI